MTPQRRVVQRTAVEAFHHFLFHCLPSYALAVFDARNLQPTLQYISHLRVADQTLTKGQMAWGLVSTTEVKAGAGGARFIVVSGQPIGESIVQAGPFVMNSEQEIRQAIVDYQRGRLTA